MGCFAIREDDLSGEAPRALLALHRGNGRGLAAPGRCSHSISRVCARLEVTAWRGEDLAAIGAGAAIPDHIAANARRGGIAKLGREIGGGAAFKPVLAFCAAQGFVEGDAFASYPDNRFRRLFPAPLFA